MFATVFFSKWIPFKLLDLNVISATCSFEIFFLLEIFILAFIFFKILKKVILVLLIFTFFIFISDLDVIKAAEPTIAAADGSPAIKKLLAFNSFCPIILIIFFSLNSLIWIFPPNFFNKISVWFLVGIFSIIVVKPGELSDAINIADLIWADGIFWL